MVERLTAMPAGTFGFRFAGRIDAADYRDVLIPALREGVESGELRALFVIGPEYEGFDLGALKEDLKGAVPLALEHRGAWKRVAILTEIEWIAKAVDAFSWAVPGEARVFALAALEPAKAWIAGSVD